MPGAFSIHKNFVVIIIKKGEIARQQKHTMENHSRKIYIFVPDSPSTISFIPGVIPCRLKPDLNIDRWRISDVLHTSGKLTQDRYGILKKGKNNGKY
jgi:hypothetical protein